MPVSLVKPTAKNLPKTIKVNLPENLIKTMEQYGEWAGFESQDNLIEKCVSYVIENDKHFARLMRENKS